MSEANELGLSRRQVQTLLDNGHWQPLARGVYLSAQHHLTDAARLRIAVATYRGTADRTAAAWWHGLLEDLPPVISLSVPVSSRNRGRGTIPVQCMRRSYPAEDTELLRGVPTVRAPLAVLGAAAELEARDGDGVALLDRSLQIGAVTPESLIRCLERLSGKHGLTPSRSLVAVLEAGCESEAERVFVALLRDHGIDGWVPQLPFARGRIDFAWVDRKVAVEIQGWSWHRDHDRYENDNEKAALLTAAGWEYLPFTWKKLTREPQWCIDRLLAALNRVG